MLLLTQSVCWLFKTPIVVDCCKFNLNKAMSTHQEFVAMTLTRLCSARTLRFENEAEVNLHLFPLDLGTSSGVWLRGILACDWGLRLLPWEMNSLDSPCRLNSEVYLSSRTSIACCSCYSTSQRSHLGILSFSTIQGSPFFLDHRSAILLFFAL